MKFLNQETAVQFGSEMLANSHNHAVVFFATRKVRRGYYTVEFELIARNPRECPWGEITEKHTQLLEKEILQAPENWIWSHKRWKREVPGNLEELKENQRNAFNEKYRQEVLD